MNTRLPRRLAAATLALAIPLSGTVVAQAEPMQSDSGVASGNTAQPNGSNASGSYRVHSHQSELTPEQLKKAYSELNDSDLPRRSVTEDGHRMVVFTLPSAGELALPDFDAPQPYVNGGRNGFSGFWLEFTPREQDLLISGGGFALGAGICAIPAVGQAACIVIGAIITAASWAVSSYGKCDSRLHIDFGWDGKARGVRCI